MQTIQIPPDLVMAFTNVILAIAAIIAICIAIRQNVIHKKTNNPYCNINCVDCAQKFPIKHYVIYQERYGRVGGTFSTFYLILAAENI